MSISDLNTLGGFSDAVAELVAKTALGIVAIKGAHYRTSSGIAIHPDVIACANHALKREETVDVVPSNGRPFQAKVLGRVAGLDLAILTAEGASLTTLEPAQMSTLKAGALVAAVGWTTDVGASASLGILGAVGASRRTWRGGRLDHFLRLDVNLYPSQSGAAVVDAEGRLIGMATPALSRHAGVAVPINTIHRVAGELKSLGRIRTGYIGVAAQEVPVPTNLREKLESPVESGLMLLNVEPESPAERAGLLLGDILVLLDEEAIGNIEQLQNVLGGESVGNTLSAVVIRGGAPLRLSIIVGERSSTRRNKDGD